MVGDGNGIFDSASAAFAGMGQSGIGRWPAR
jgi:hypothetical protein